MSTPLFPSEWSKIWIRGTFINLDGTPMTGQVTFAANVTGKTMIASAAKKLIGAKGLSVALDGSGYFQLQIPATNDPDITPLNFTYTVSEPTGRTYPITVPWNTPALSAPSDPLNGQQVIDLTDIVPSPGASGGVGQLLRGIGIQSTTVDGNGHLLVTYTDGRTEDAGFIGSGGSGTVPDATTTVKGKQVLLGGTADAPTVPYGKVTGAPASLPPSGGAGGVLSGNYPNPAFAVDMATQAELDAVSSAKADTSALTAHTSRTDNPHTTTKQQVGLGNVDNTADASKPISGPQQAALAPKTRDLAGRSSPATDLRLYGQIVDVGTTGQFDAGYVESPCVFLDPASGRLAMVYTGYSGPGAGGTASVGLAYSDDGLNWTKAGQMFAGTGVDGDPDKGGVTGPVVVVDGGLYHLFYIGLTEAGYEAGTKSICRASATSLSGPWTRHGTIVSAGSGWRAGAVWHPNLVFAKGRWYLFFNAGTTVERCGYATADTLAGPWTVDDANSPVLPETGHTADGIWGGDPFVWREGDHWRMDFANADSNFAAVGDFWATTTDEEFPLGWKVRGQATQFSQLHPFKPWIYRFNGRIFHYGTNGRIRVMVAPDLTMQSPLVTGRWRFKPPNGGADGTIGNIPSMVVGDDLVMWTGPNRSKLMIGNTSGNSELLVGQDSTHAILFAWNYAASPAGAAAALETYGGSNELQIQNNAGPVRLGGSSGRIGFFGANPSTRPTAQAAADSSTVDTTYGTEEAAVINNLRTRLGTLEAKLKTLGLLS